MFKIPLVICFLITLYSFPVAKADIIIEYKVFVGHENPLIDRALMIPERITVSFSDKFVRIQTISSQSTIANRFDLYPLGRDFYYFCADFMGQKKAFKTKKKNEYEISYPSDSIYSIIGNRCKKAYGKGENGEVEIFYTDDFGIHFFPHGELNGFALKYTKPDKFFGSITYEAVSMTAGELPKENFDISDFQISYPKSAPTKNKTWDGKNLPPIEAETLNELKYTLETRGKITVINYWFLGCKPCRMEIPCLNELVKKYQDNQEVQFIAITLDKPEAINKFMKEGNIFNYQIVGNGQKAANKSRVLSYPTHFVVDQNGKVVEEWHNYTPTTVVEISQKIDELLDKK
jgi:thiol-disulfide isomerase/thioredoxin